MKQRSRPRNQLNNQSGQVVVEYILLLLLAVAVSLIITRQLIGSSEDSPGIVLERWSLIISRIGSDLPDDLAD